MAFYRSADGLCRGLLPLVAFLRVRRDGASGQDDLRGNAKTTPSLPLPRSYPMLTLTTIPWPRLRLLGFGVINRPQTKEVIPPESSLAT